MTAPDKFMAHLPVEETSARAPLSNTGFRNIVMLSDEGEHLQNLTTSLMRLPATYLSVHPK